MSTGSIISAPTAPARSTLADANAKRPAQLFADLFAVLAAQASPGLRRATREAIHLVDASSIRLTEISRAWANYQAHGALVKLHVDFDADGAIPANFAITPARVNDVEHGPHPADRERRHLCLRPWIL